jgi:antitoxin (DNA-binding transcriptional repressor) of toxin-antitoxin stability system
MSSMKNIGVREFRDHTTRYLAAPEPVAIHRHGKVIGFYTPLRRDEGKVRDAIAQLGKAVERVIDETGISEDELAKLPFH